MLSGLLTVSQAPLPFNFLDAILGINAVLFGPGGLDVLVEGGGAVPVALFVAAGGGDEEGFGVSAVELEFGGAEGGDVVRWGERGVEVPQVEPLNEGSEAELRAGSALQRAADRVEEAENVDVDQ